MHDEAPGFIDFPDLPDEAVIVLNDFLEIFITRFQNHYFTQLRRACHDQAAPVGDTGQQVLPFNDPPF